MLRPSPHRIQLSAPDVASSGRALKRTRDDVDASPPALEPVSLNLVPPQDARRCDPHQLEAKEEDDESICASPIDEPENVEPTREAYSVSVCAVGCRRRWGHVGLCFTEHGIAPPSVKRRHALSKMRHAQPFRTLEHGAPPTTPTFAANH